ncbi:unnamed protein product [Dracunculus medinensis]|uniref:Uncharacterized protein n=1 Tax=Dracunculus medinensis TaxID=318479 RepID=A0A0N4UHL6_DRAME|nr:unnamed protein product [Dracunculus medinensis]
MGYKKETDESTDKTADKSVFFLDSEEESGIIVLSSSKDIEKRLKIRECKATEGASLNSIFIKACLIP